MIVKCKFNKERDFQEVVPDLAISIQEAIVTGLIKDTGTSTPYSKITSTDEVGNYLHDAIDIAMAAKRLGEKMSATSGPVNTESATNPN